jgi:hypothetical protein
LKQIGVGLQNYHDSFKVFPWGNYTPGNCCSTQSGTNWAISILPFIEQGAIYDTYDQNITNEQQPILPNGYCVVQQIVSTYNCPSDINALILENPGSGALVNKAYRHSSYRGITGIGRNDGYFDNNQWIGVLNEREKGLLHTVGTGGLTNEKIATVLDGTSNTLAVGEYMTTTTTNRGTFWAYSYTCYSVGSIQYESRHFIPDYNLCASLPGVPAGSNPCKRALASFHPGGINYAIADGSTRFISNSVDLVGVLGPAATIMGQEAAPLP